MQIRVWLALSFLPLHALAPRCPVARADVGQRDTVLDRKVVIHEGIAEVPDVPPLCDTTPELDKRRVDVEGGTLYCELEGTGTPLVLVSGGPGCSHHVFHPSFSRASAFAQVIYYDQRGTGDSDPDPTGERYKLKQAVEDLDRLRNELGIDRWVVLGHSYGGFLAQCYALEHPERLAGLVLVASRPGMPGVRLERTRQYDFLSKEERERIRKIRAEPGLSLAQLVYNTHLVGDWKRQRYYRPSETELARTARYEWTPAPGLREGLGLDLDHVDLDGKFGDFTIPTLLIEAKWDLTWNTDKPGRLSENHPHARLVVFEHSGHSPFDDEPDRFFSVLAEFVSEVERRAPVNDVAPQTILYPTPLVGDIDSLETEGSGERALELLGRAEAESLVIAESWIALGISLYGDRHYTEALSAFRRATELPHASQLDRFTGYSSQGHVRDLLGQRKEAERCYLEALELGDGLVGEIWNRWGIVLDARWLRARLKTPFERTNTAQRVGELPWTGAGEQTLQLFASARREGLNSAWTWLKLGTSLYDRGDYPDALEAFRILCASRPDFAAGLVWQGHILDLLGRRNEALACYREAKAIGVPRPMELVAYGMVIDASWIDARLETPFSRK